MEWLQQDGRKLLLGQMLVRENLISRSQLARVVERQRKTGQRLGDVVHELDLVPRRMIDAVQRKQRLMRVVASIIAILLYPIYIPGYTSRSLEPVATIAAKTRVHATPRQKSARKLPKQGFYDLSAAVSTKGLEVVELDAQKGLDLWSHTGQKTTINVGKKMDYRATT